MSAEIENQEIENEGASAEGQNQEQQSQEEIKTWSVVEPNSMPTEGITKLYEEVPTDEEVKNDEITKDENEIEESNEVLNDELQEEYVELDEDYALAYLAKSKGVSVDELKENLIKKDALEVDEETKKFLEYKKETGRSYQDFLATQKDWKAEPKENVLLQNLKAENPTLTDAQIERLFKRNYEFDAEYDDEDVVLDKQINIEKDYQKGLKLLEDQKEKYLVRRGSDETVPEEFKKAKEFVDNFNKQQEESKAINEKLRADFSAKTDQVFSKDFEGFKVKVGNSEFKIKPENVEVAKSTLSDLTNFDKKFFDQTTGELKNPTEYYKALHFAMNPDKVAEHFINIGKSIQAELEEKESKNVKTTSARGVDTNLESNVKKWNVVNP